MSLRRSRVGFGSLRGGPLALPTLAWTGQNREDALLYFTYAARIAPDRMAEAAPGASFACVAHLPEWGLRFPIDGNGWNGALPSAVPDPGSTVWGVVYNVSNDEMSRINSIEMDEGRAPTDLDAIDRSGKRYAVITHLADGPVSNEFSPSHEYVSIMVNGSRHWGLPAGWVIGLEDHLEADT